MRWRLWACVVVCGCAGGARSSSDLSADLGGRDRQAGDRNPELPVDAWVTLDGPRPADRARPDLRGPADLGKPDTKADAKIATPDVGPAGEICDNGKDDDGDDYVDCADSGCATKAPCTGQTGRTLVIHEVYSGQPDYVVLRNASSVARTTTGYRLEMWGISPSPVSFTLPTKTLQPGQTIGVVEYTGGKAGDINTNENIPFYDALMTNSNAVVLLDPFGTVLDYVGFGASSVGVPTGMSQNGGPVSYAAPYTLATQSHYRSGMSGQPSLFQRADWRAGPRSR